MKRRVGCLILAMLLCLTGMFQYSRGTQAAARKAVTVRADQKKELSVPKSWKKVTWKASNKKIRFVRKQKNKAMIQGVKPGKCVVTATCGTKKRVFAVNVTEKENAEEKGSVNVSLVSAQYTQQKITVTVNIANGMTDEICFGMDALFYRLNADGKYSPVANEVAIPMVLAVVQPGKSQEQSFACINTKEGLVQGHYKIAFTIWGGSDGEKSTMIPQEVEFDV